MPKETKENLNQQSGLGNILISAYKYLRDQSILLGTYKNPIFNTRKARIPNEPHVEKLFLAGITLSNQPIFSYKNISGNKEIRLMTFNVAVQSNKPVSFDIYKNVILTNPTWNPFDESEIIEKDTSATAFSGGKLVGGVDIPQTGGQYISLGDAPVIFTCMPNDIITIVLTVDQSSDVTLRLRLEEIDV